MVLLSNFTAVHPTKTKLEYPPPTSLSSLSYKILTIQSRVLLTDLNFSVRNEFWEYVKMACMLHLSKDMCGIPSNAYNDPNEG